MLEHVYPQMIQMLKNLSAVLDKSVAHAQENGIEVETLLNAKLAPDMFHFIRQIQSCTDTAKFVAARLSGQTPPKYEDTETTLDEVKARLQKCIDYLESFKIEDIKGGLDRKLTLPMAPEFDVLGVDYLNQFALPNFYFHVVTAYDILRHQGAPIGKRDYIGNNLNMTPKTA